MLKVRFQPGVIRYCNDKMAAVICDDTNDWPCLEGDAV